jgi:hypothetical protein
VEKIGAQRGLHKKSAQHVPFFGEVQRGEVERGAFPDAAPCNLRQLLGQAKFV